MNSTTARARFLNDGMATMSGPALLIALYDRLVRDLDVASDAVQRDLVSETHHALVHAQDIVHELALALKGSEGWDGSADLVSLYDWLYRRLIEANASKDIDLIGACLSVAASLRDAWVDGCAAFSVNDS